MLEQWYDRPLGSIPPYTPIGALFVQAQRSEITCLAREKLGMSSFAAYKGRGWEHHPVKRFSLLTHNVQVLRRSPRWIDR